jgi:protease II
MDAGHAGASGRYDSLKEIAFIYAFILQTSRENYAYEYED